MTEHEKYNDRLAQFVCAVTEAMVLERVLNAIEGNMRGSHGMSRGSEESKISSIVVKVFKMAEAMLKEFEKRKKE